MSVPRILATAAVAVALSCANTAAIAQSNVPLTNGYLTGTWKEDQQCRGGDAVVFTPNNMMSSAGSPPVRYAVSGPAQITVYGPGGAAAMNVKPINQNRMVLTVGNDAGILYRCTGGGGGGGGGQFSSNYLTGGWGENGNCAAPDVFTANGQMVAANGATVNWAVFGNTLRLTGAGGAVDFTVQTNGRRNMSLTQNNTGQTSNYVRCF